MMNRQDLCSSFLQCFDSVHAAQLLRVLAQGFLAEGYDRQEVVDAVGDARLVLQRAQRERDEDALLDLLDAMSGWSPPGTQF